MQQDGLVCEQWREALGQAQQGHLRPENIKRLPFCFVPEGKF